MTRVHRVTNKLFDTLILIATAGVLAFFFVVFVTLVVLSVLFPLLAMAHDTEVSACFNGGKPVKPMGARAHPSGLWAEAYARQNALDVLAMSPITGYQYNWNKDGQDDLLVEHSEHPVTYLVDTDGDGKFDESFVDKGGQGKCDEIEHYEYVGERAVEDDENNPKREASEQWSLG